MQVLDNLKDLLDQNGRKTHGRLVEHKELGVAHEGATHGEHLLLAAGKGAGDLLAALLQAREVVVDALQAGAMVDLGCV